MYVELRAQKVTCMCPCACLFTLVLLQHLENLLVHLKDLVMKHNVTEVYISSLILHLHPYIFIALLLGSG